jgi:Toprim domain-containing protein/CHC2-type zinc finger protein
MTNSPDLRAIPSDMIERARAMRIEAETERRGIKLRGGHDRCGPCPSCGGVDRFAINIQKQVFLCRRCDAGGDVIDLVQLLDGCDFRKAVERLTGESVIDKDPWKQREPQQRTPATVTSTADALKLWSEGLDPRGTLAEIYLATRRLDLSEDLAGNVLRWHPRIGAMLALFRNIRMDEPQAISRTFLDGEGRKIERKFLGPVAGCAVKLDADGEVTNGLHIGEGVETTMTARQVEDRRPAWALGSAGAIAAFPVLSGIECLTLLAEHCDANARAIKQCGDRWCEAGREVLVNEPIGGKDLNDALQRRASQ